MPTLTINISVRFRAFGITFGTVKINKTVPIMPGVPVSVSQNGVDLTATYNEAGIAPTTGG